MNNKKNEPNIIRVIVNCFFILATLCFAVLAIENLKPLLATGDPTTNNCQYNETSCDYIMLQSGFHQELSVSAASTIAVVSFATVVINIGILAVYNRR